MFTRKIFKGYMILICLSVLIIVAACSHDEVQESIIVESEQQDNTPQFTESGTMGPFWKVENNGNVVYLLGSIHVAKSDLYPLHEKIERAFSESKVLAVEADVLNTNPFALQKLIDERARYSDGTTLRDHLSPYTYARVKRAFSNQRLSLAMFEAYEPWYISMLLDSLYLLKTDYDENLGVDMYFLKKAHGVKDIHELEGIVFQLDMMDSFSEDLQVVQLVSSLSYDEEQYREELEKLFAAWKSGREEDLLAFISYPDDLSEEERSWMEEYYKVMLDDRNVGMVDKIEAYLTNSNPSTYFVVVGAAHYVGDMGIVQLLTDRGYSVEKITP